MGLFSSLLGCKTADATGPDFESAIAKVIHIKAGASISYEMPGNMSSRMSFAARYAEESPRTVTFDCQDSASFEKSYWRDASNLDGAMWDYADKTSSGRNVAELNLQIDVSPQREGTTLRELVGAQYDDFLNGADGVNTKVRQSNPDLSDGELGQWIVAVPTDFRHIDINQTRALRWSVAGELTGRHSEYIAIPTGANCFVTFHFHYSLSSNSDEERAKTSASIAAVIESFVEKIGVD